MEGTTSLIQESIESHFRILRLSAPNHNYNQDHSHNKVFCARVCSEYVYETCSQILYQAGSCGSCDIQGYGQRESKPLMCAVEIGYGCWCISIDFKASESQNHEGVLWNRVDDVVEQELTQELNGLRFEDVDDIPIDFKVRESSKYCLNKFIISRRIQVKF